MTKNDGPYYINVSKGKEVVLKQFTNISGTKKKFGTDNNLFADDEKIKSLTKVKSRGESCQVSSIIWCKMCLLNKKCGPECNVHEDEEGKKL